MKSANWKEVAELVGTAAIVATLVFVGFQMRQAQAIAQGEMNAAVLANAIAGSNAIIANADIWVRGNVGEKLTPVEEAIFVHLVTNINDRAYYGVQHQRLLGIATADVDIADYAGFLYENPGARRVWRAREANLQKYRALINPDERTSPEWIEAVESKLAIFDRQGETTVQ